MIYAEIYTDIPVVQEYKYLGIWLNEKLSPSRHLEKMNKKIDYFISRLKIIPKQTITPKLLINLWTVLIRPLYDYAICHAKLSGGKKLEEYIAREVRSFEQTLGLRISTPSNLIMQMMGYDPKLFADHIIAVSHEKWTARTERKTIQTKYINYKIKTDPILLSWAVLKTSNLLWNHCEAHNCSISPLHIKQMHDTQFIEPNIERLLKDGLQVKRRYQRTKRRGKILKIVEKTYKRQQNQLIRIVSSLNYRDRSFNVMHEPYIDIVSVE